MGQALEDGERASATQVLANYALFERAQSASIENIVSNAVLTREPTGSLLLVEGSAASVVTFVLEGVVRIFHSSPEGREFTPKILRAPNHFGDLERLSGQTINGQSVAALTEVVVGRLSWAVLESCLEEDHALALSWLSGISSQFLYTIDADRHNVFLGLPGRVANTLLSYADVFGEVHRRGITIARALTREDLANQVGSVKRAVVRVVRTFVDQGWVSTDGSTLTVRSPEALARFTLPRRLGLGHDMLDVRGKK